MARESSHVNDLEKSQIQLIYMAKWLTNDKIRGAFNKSWALAN